MAPRKEKPEKVGTEQGIIDLSLGAIELLTDKRSL